MGVKRYGECSCCQNDVFVKEPILWLLPDGRGFTTGLDLWTCVYCTTRHVADQLSGPKRLFRATNEGKQMIADARKETMRGLEAMGVGV